jgi:hypothetical protein
MLIGCSKTRLSNIENLLPEHKGKYFIELQIFDLKKDAINFGNKIAINDEELVHLFRDTVKQKVIYIVCLGPYNSSYSAGENAFKFYSAKEINDYNIIRDFLPVFDEFSNILIVSSYNGNASLYSYNLKSLKSELFWQKYGEKVIELENAKDTCLSFFITAQKTDRKGIFPFLTDVKFYKADLFWNKIELLNNLDNAIQIFTDWENINSFKVILNSFDDKVSTFINQRVLIYNTNGKNITNIFKTFDLVKENYPQLPDHIKKMISPDKKYFLLDSIISGRNDFYIKTFSKKHFIFSTEQSLNAVEWINNKFIVFSTSNILPSNKSIFSKLPQTSTLTVYDLRNKRIVRQWKNDGVKNFIVKSDYLFFDDGFGRKSKIFIYHLTSDEIIDTISLAGGCGIKNIPYFPKFN